MVVPAANPYRDVGDVAQTLEAAPHFEVPEAHALDRAFAPSR
jgi:hypothetical protein